MAILIGALPQLARAAILVATAYASGCAATCEAAADHVRACAEDTDAGEDDDSPAERADDLRATCDAVPEIGRGPLADCIIAASCEDLAAAADPERLCAASTDGAATSP